MDHRLLVSEFLGLVASSFTNFRFRATTRVVDVPGFLSLTRGGLKQQVASIAFILNLCLACDGGELTPVAPSDAPSSDAEVVQDVSLQWSPYVGVHVDGQALDTYGDAISDLRSNGQLQGVRVEITPTLKPTEPVIRNISSAGVELLALIGNDYLFAENIEREIDKIFASFPEIRYFQVGNEVTSLSAVAGPTIDIVQYMSIFRRIYDHVQNHYRGRITLLTQSPLGSGLDGPRELEAMVAHGLEEVDPDSVIIGLNAYDLDTAVQYLGLLGGPLRRYRVWVTESGVRNPDLHISWVRDNYPQLRNLLRAERVYWYTMWGGDFGPDTDFSLVKNPGNYPNYWRSPLFEVLTVAP